MVIIFDTCVVLDYLLDRKPYSDHSRKLFKLAGDYHFDGLITVKTICDIHYFLKRFHHDEVVVRSLINNLLKILNCADSSTIDMYGALKSDLVDFEDALIECAASRIKADYIVTRNMKDFKKSRVPAILPEDLMKILPNYSID